MRAVAYVRVSSSSQVEGHSLDAQERLFYELCKNRKWDPIRVYREEGRSAKHEGISRSLATHVSKVLDQRASEGKHTGGIPFGYVSCWAKGEKGEKVCICDPEHPEGSIPMTKKDLLSPSYSGGISSAQLP